MRRGYQLTGTRYQHDIARGFQGSLMGAEDSVAYNQAVSVRAEVVQVYSDKNACDVRTISGNTVPNVPVLTSAGLINNQVYGELDLPSVGDIVLVEFVGGIMERPYIIGTIIPYSNVQFQSSQVPVNSTTKAFTKKLLESGKNNTYRKIFKSGATLEVNEQGSVIIEVPSGEYLKIDTQNGRIELDGNTKDLVTHAELDTALQTMINLIMLHVHTCAIPGNPSSVPTAPITVNIVAAKALKLKTG
jgi:hypothetical protein